MLGVEGPQVGHLLLRRPSRMQQALPDGLHELAVAEGIDQRIGRQGLEARQRAADAIQQGLEAFRPGAVAEGWIGHAPERFDVRKARLARCPIPTARLQIGELFHGKDLDRHIGKTVDRRLGCEMRSQIWRQRNERGALLPTECCAFSLDMAQIGEFKLRKIEAGNTGVAGAFAVANKKHFHNESYRARGTSRGIVLQTCIAGARCASALFKTTLEELL